MTILVRKEQLEDFPAYLPVGALEARLFPVVHAFPVTCFTVLFQHGTVIHERIVPLPGVIPVEGLLDQGEELRSLTCSPGKEEVDENGPYVCLDKDNGNVEGEGEDSGGRRRADTGQCSQHIRETGQHAAEFGA